MTCLKIRIQRQHVEETHENYLSNGFVREMVLVPQDFADLWREVSLVRVLNKLYIWNYWKHRREISLPSRHVIEYLRQI